MYCKLKLIDSVRFLTSLLSNLVEGIHKINVNMDMIIKNVKNMKLNTKIANATLNV